MKKALLPEEFQQKIIRWFDKHGRKNLPWQLDKTPYRVWVSEVMLQQTQVSTVIPYFERFMQHFPTVDALSKATEDDVLHLWTGLGYYSRARNLHQTAKKIMRDHAGLFPDTLDTLQQLKGIGRSTAGAILALAFQQKATILDGNVKRVLIRFSGITEWSGEKSTLETLWRIAELFTPTKRIADYTQAMMDLGAMICVRGKPLCDVCPLERFCVAKQSGMEKSLPKPKPKKILPVKSATLLVIRHKETVFLQKRPATGIWGGLWSLPEYAGFIEENSLFERCENEFNLIPQKIVRGVIFRHTFSHYHLDILPIYLKVKATSTRNMTNQDEIWYNPDGQQKIGLPAPVKKIMESGKT
ncbi:MAG TPA: A/G-specific adenine glycosylase [Gammaproteobacteria bacterium]|nr:A/G-specific adenine glycosylase [Gammaproteobacteria bacterium]